uniref:Kinesin-4 n=1 Tax=Anthurium amnicola TaxID=1678845 RepID=A0A1D1YMM2_9ARAE
MSPPEGILSFSVASVVEDVLRQHGARLSDIDLASRKAEEAANRRYEAAGWLRKIVGFEAKDLPDKPTEEELRLGLGNGLILCNALNKVHPGAVPKVVENPGDSALLPDGAALSAYQYFENVRNLLDAVQDKGLPTFEASDLEQGGKSARIVNCILALKSYSEWKQTGGKGPWKYSGNLKAVSSGKYFIRKNSEPFMNSLSRNLLSSEKSQDDQNSCGDINEGSTEMATSHSLNKLVRAVLSDRKPEEVPSVVESLLKKILVEFERQIANQNELVKTALKDINSDGTKSFFQRRVLAELAVASDEAKDEECTHQRKETRLTETSIPAEESKHRLAKQLTLFKEQQRDIEELKHILHSTKAGMQIMQMKYVEELSILGKHLNSLAHAASGYHTLLEENRKLYNEVQDLKGSIRVYCRVRPFVPGQQSSVGTIGHVDDGNIAIINPSNYGKEGCRSFTFNKVFGPSATQDEVYLDTQPLIRSVLDGYNVCIFAYGQTGSGKTYTMTGPKDITEESRGVNYRALSDLFYLSEHRTDTFCYDIAVQMIEIYNEQVRDLLASDGLNRKLEIRNSSQKGLNVPDANLVPVASTAEVIELMNIGQRNRAVGATALNDRSSRSHSCLTVHVQGRAIASGTIFRGCMHLVDLAGSERVDKSEVKGERLKEAQHINKSLSALGDVIAALAQKSTHVPYRNSKLTQLLQDSLGGQAKTLMFVHISPEPDAIGETISTLKFAERVSTVELGAARLNKESGEIKDLKEQIACLKTALARKGEHVHVQSVLSTPEMDRIKAGTPLSALPLQQSEVNILLGSTKKKQQLEGSGNIEANYMMWHKSPSFDLEEVLATADSPPWPDSSPVVSFQGAEEREASSGDWVDKIMVNKQDSQVRYENSFGDWGGETSHLPYQGYSPNMGVYSDQLYNRNGVSRQDSHEFDIQRSRFQPSSTDGSEEPEVATSDSSEADLLWQCNPPTATSIVAGSGTRIKKTKSPNIRTPIQSHGPSPSRKCANGSGQSIYRTGRQQISSAASGKRHLPNGK